MDIRYPINEGMPKLPPFRFGAWILPLAIIFIVFLAMGSVFYEVGPDEVGVVQFFGKYVRTTNPGLHSKMPFGIETVRKIKVTHVFKEEFGFRTVSAGVRSVFSGRSDEDASPLKGNRQYQGGDLFLEESLMLT